MKMLIIFYNTVYVRDTRINNLNNNLLYLLGRDLLLYNFACLLVALQLCLFIKGNNIKWEKKSHS